MADYFEAVVTAGADAKLAANWITGDIAAYEHNRLSYGELPFRPEQLAEMVQLIDGGKISGNRQGDSSGAAGESGHPKRLSTSAVSG